MQIKMHPTRLFKKALLANIIYISACQVNAAGFQLNAQSATGLGRAFAGDAVIADNASVISRNAAAMTLFDKTSLSLGANILATEILVSDATYKNITGFEGSSDYDNAGGTSVVPNLYVIFPIDERFAVGASLYSNFATKSKFDDSFVGAEYGGLTDVKSVNFGLTGSYRINKQWSVGAGLDLIYGSGKLQRTTSKYLGSKTVLEADASGFGLGFNVGTVFELNKNNRFGLSYHHSPKLAAEGEITYTGKEVNNDTLYLGLPNMAEFSGYHRLGDAPYALHYSIQWIGWSSFDALRSKAHGSLNDYEWKNAMHFALGGTYYLNNTWTLRAGYMYDQSAQDEIASISVPDSDRQWFSVGLTYQLSKNANIDFGATYLLGKDVAVSESTGALSSIVGTTRANGILTGMQYSHQF